ncbi:hypothetical protein M1E08_09265 [Erwinia sp. PK3-005]|uniref:Uncharacterized protein n=1 Tax=Mixta hanseatica TaxID=2872648 RepID=A0ABY4R720_9GAMM|nr:hypothetical protein [Mixta hanseatica]UQY42535.1 hypothetical protein K6958_11275 [Mixta hanseatica]
MEDGLTVALSPIQLAAVLSRHNLTEAEMLGNRLLGGLSTYLKELAQQGY